MKYVILSAAAGFAIIGFHQVMVNSSTSISDGVAASYWLFMLSIGMLFWYQILNKKEVEQVKEDDKPQKKTQGAPKAQGKVRKKRKKIG